jgi:hypothetical protein
MVGHNKKIQIRSVRCPDNLFYGAAPIGITGMHMNNPGISDGFLSGRLAIRSRLFIPDSHHRIGNPHKNDKGSDDL